MAVKYRDSGSGGDYFWDQASMSDGTKENVVYTHINWNQR